MSRVPRLLLVLWSLGTVSYAASVGWSMAYDQLPHWASLLLLLITGLGLFLLWGWLMKLVFRELPKASVAHETAERIEGQLETAEQRNDLIVASALDAIIVMDKEGKVRDFNPAAEELFGYRYEEIVGTDASQLISAEDLIDADGQGLLPLAVNKHGQILGRRLERRGTRADGSQLPVELTVTALGLDSEDPWFVAFVHDLTERQLAQANESYLAALVASSEDAIIAKNLEGIVLNFNAAAERLYGYEADEIIGCPVTVMFPEGREDEYERIMASVRAGQAVEHYETQRVAKDGTTIDVAVTISPIRDALGQIIGASSVARDIRRRRKAEERLRFLAEVWALLGRSLESEKVLADLAQLLIPQLGDWCFVTGWSENQFKLLAVAHKDPDRVQEIKNLEEQYPPNPEDPVTAELLAGGEPVLVEEVTDEMLRAGARDDEMFQLIRSLGFTSGMVVPITAHGEVFGVITLASSDRHHRFTNDDLSLAVEVGRRAGLALENARLYETNRHIAEVLQESLLPPELPQLPAGKLSALYEPAGEGSSEVGGDFYDCFPISDEGQWAMAIGDVCGKGPQAAALTATVRYALRGSALSHSSAAAVLKDLNRIVLREEGDHRFCTAIFGFLDCHDGAMTLRFALGGHPRPLLLRQGKATPVGKPGALLGVFERFRAHDTEIEFQAGDKIILYTDGVTESRRPGDGAQLGEDGLQRIIEEASHYNDGALLDHIRQQVIAWRDGQPAQDDIGILVISATSSTCNRLFEPDPSSVARARAALSVLARQHPAIDWDSARLLVSELVSNAILYGASRRLEDRVQLSATVVDGTLRVEVRNPGTGFEFKRRDLHDLSEKQAVSGRGLALVEQMSDRWEIVQENNMTCVWFEMQADDNAVAPEVVDLLGVA